MKRAMDDEEWVDAPARSRPPSKKRKIRRASNSDSEREWVAAESEFAAADESDMKTAVKELWEALCIHNKQPDTKAILENYYQEVDEEDATLVTLFVNLGLKACGSHAILSEEAVQIPYNQESQRLKVLKYIAGEADASAELPTMENKNPRTRRIRERLAMWWRKLVKYIHNHPNITDEDKTIEVLSHWFIDLSGSKIRSFRDVGTQLCLNICSGLIYAAVDYAKQFDNTERAIEAETRKPHPSEARISQLDSARQDYTAKITLIHEQIRPIFNKVFIHRYRDICPTIRVLCMEGLGRWIAEYPAVFLEDPKLKYLGWCLSDKHVAVRKEALRSLHKIFKPANYQRLTNFMERFKPRLLEMTKDRDPSIAAEAIDVTCTLLREDLLDTNDGDDIAGYVYCSPEEIRKSSANFIYFDSFDQQFNKQEGEEEPNEDQRIVEDLIELLDQFTNEMRERFPDSAEYLRPAEFYVNALWPMLTCLKNWHAMVDLIMSAEEDAHKKREKALDNKGDAELNDVQQTLMFYILLAAGRKACSLGSADGQIDRNKKKTREEKAEAEACKENFIKAMVDRLPKLLFTFSQDPNKLKVLVQLAIMIPGSAFNRPEVAPKYKEMVKTLKNAYPLLSSTPVIKEMARALGHMCHISRTKVPEVKQMVEELSKKLVTDFEEATEAQNRDLRLLYVTSLRLAELNKTFNVREVDMNNPESPICLILEQSIAEEDEHEIATNLIRLLLGRLYWCIGELDWSDPRPGIVDDCRLLKENLVNMVIKACQENRMEDTPLWRGVMCEVTQALLMMAPRANQHADVADLSQPLQSREMLQFMADSFRNQLSEIADQEKAEENRRQPAQQSSNDASPHTRKTERLRILAMGTRLCIQDPDQYNSFGTLVLEQFGRINDEFNALIKCSMNAIKKAHGTEVLLDLFLDTLKSLHRNRATSKELQDLSKKMSLFLNFDKHANWGSFVTKLLKHGMDNPQNYGFLQPTVLSVVNRIKIDDREKIKQRYLKVKSDLPPLGQDVGEYRSLLENFESELMNRLNRGRRPVPQPEPVFQDANANIAPDPGANGDMLDDMSMGVDEGGFGNTSAIPGNDDLLDSQDSIEM